MTTLKLEGDLNMLKCTFYTENEVVRLRQSKFFFIMDDICMAITSGKNTKISLKVKVKVKCHQLPTTSSIHHETYSYQVISLSD